MSKVSVPFISIFMDLLSGLCKRCLYGKWPELLFREMFP